MMTDENEMIEGTRGGVVKNFLYDKMGLSMDMCKSHDQAQ